MVYALIQARLEFEIEVYSPRPRLHVYPDPGLNLDHNPCVGGGGMRPESDQDLNQD